MSKELYFNYYLSHFIVSDVSGFLIRRQNRPDILSAGEEVDNAIIPLPAMRRKLNVLGDNIA